jgi:hypothetical protein
MKIINFALFAFLALTSCQPKQQARTAPWSIEQANRWYESVGWLTGVNYIVSDAVNSIEMFDKTSYNPDLIDRELKLAEGLGFNCIRVLVPYALYADDPDYLFTTFDNFLSICKKHKITVMPVLFDDCHFGLDECITVGKQPEPCFGWYASYWTRSPGKKNAEDETVHPKLENYVKSFLKRFRNDSRIAVWDLYNEPLNCTVESWELVKKVFPWAREVNPTQPLTIGVWYNNEDLNRLIEDNSDIITYHFYGDGNGMASHIEKWKKLNRPVLCTEWLNRPRKSLIPDIMPMLKEQRVGSFMWGLVNGKTQTHLPWGHRPEHLPYTGLWQHDLYHSDFTPYDTTELEIIKSCKP